MPTADTIPLHVVRVVFKDEDEIDGQTVGPCYVYTNRRDDRGRAYRDLGWIPKSQALAVAKKFEVELLEF